MRTLLKKTWNDFRRNSCILKVRGGIRSISANIQQYLRILLLGAILSSCGIQPPVLEDIGSGKELVDGRLYLPTTQGPYPVVIDLHGCSGIWPARTKFWVPILLEQGFAVFKVDSFTPRGVDNVCADVFRVSPQQRTFDIANAIRFILKDRRFDSDGIFLMGMSHGGTTVLLTNTYFSPLFSRLKGAIAYYPYCLDELPVLNTDLQIFIGDADDWTPASRCSNMKIGDTRGNQMELIVYPGAYHDFDVPGISQTYLGHQLQYDAAASKDSISKVKRFLRMRRH